MADTVTPRWRLSAAEFLQWEERQHEKFELFDGIPEAMAGGTFRHATIQGNIFAALRVKLRGSPCRAINADFKTQAVEDFYYPDVTVDCGDIAGGALFTPTPAIVFEVLSRSTRNKDLRLKLPNYKATPTVQQIVYVDSETQALTIWSRDGEGWKEEEMEHGATLQLPTIGAELTFEEIYEDVDFAA